MCFGYCFVFFHLWYNLISYSLCVSPDSQSNQFMHVCATCNEIPSRCFSHMIVTNIIWMWGHSSVSLSPSGSLWQIWRKSRQVLLRYFIRMETNGQTHEQSAIIRTSSAHRRKKLKQHLCIMQFLATWGQCNNNHCGVSIHLACRV